MWRIRKVRARTRLRKSEIRQATDGWKQIGEPIAGVLIAVGLLTIVVNIFRHGRAYMGTYGRFAAGDDQTGG